jgi:oligoribonuclease
MSSEFLRWANKRNMEVHDDTEHGSLEAKDILPWVDIETTGLNMQKDVVLEVGVLLTDGFGRLIEDAKYDILVYDSTPKYQFAVGAMIPYVKNMHEQSGLLHDLDLAGRREDGHEFFHPDDAADLLRDFMLDWGLEATTAEFAGSSVHFDREMLRNNDMEKFEGHFHYRNLDISTIKNACRRLNPRVFSKLDDAVSPVKQHRPLDDLCQSIREYQFYIDNFLWTAETGYEPPIEVR